jgi:hypothetical protein
MANSRYIRAYPALLLAGTEASRLAYNHISMVASGSALMQLHTGRRSITMNSVITDHQARFIKTMEHVLRCPKAREQLRALLDGYAAEA